MYILGISAFYHDSAACLLRDGEIIAAGKKNGLLVRNMMLASCSCNSVLHKRGWNSGKGYRQCRILRKAVC